jgi:hypothetical protein
MKKVLLFAAAAFLLIAIVSCMSDNYVVKASKGVKEPIYIDTVTIWVRVGQVEGANFSAFPSAIYKNVDWGKIASILSGHGTPVIFEAAGLTNIKYNTNGIDNDYDITVSDGNRHSEFALGGEVKNWAHAGYGGLSLTIAINKDCSSCSEIVATGSYSFIAYNTNFDEAIIKNDDTVLEDVKVNNLPQIIDQINARFPLVVAKNVKESEEQ